MPGHCRSRGGRSRRTWEQSRHRIGPILGAISAVALFACSICPAAAGSNLTSHTPSNQNMVQWLATGKPLLVHLPAGGSRSFLFHLCAGCFAELRIEQLGWMVSAEVRGPGISAATPRSLDAGLRSIIRIPVIGTGDGSYRLNVHVRHGNLPAQVRIESSIAHPATMRDRDEVEASQYLAEAEMQRRVQQKIAAGKAIALYDRAFPLAVKCNDDRLEQLILLGKARVYLFRTGEYVAGLHEALAALALSHRREASSLMPEEIALRAFTWKVLASAYAFLAEYPRMIDATNHSLKLYRQLGDAYWQGILQGNVANVYLETGDLQHALASAEDALTIARRLSDDWGIAFTEATLGMIREERGEYQAAFDANGAALRVMRQINDPDEEGQVWMDDAELYDDLNDPEREREALMQALPLLRQTGDAVNESEALSDLSLLDLREHRLRDASATIHRAMQIARTRDLHREEAMAYLGEAEVLAADGEAVQAIDAIHEGLALAANTEEAATKALLKQEDGDLLARQHDATAAMAAYRDAERGWLAISNPERAALAQASMARLEFRAGHLQAASRDIHLALDGFEISRRQIGGRILRESFFASVHDFYDLAIAIELRSQAATGSSSADLDAWRIAELARGRALMDAIRSSSRISARDLPSRLMDRNAILERDITSTLNTIVKFRGGGGSPTALRQQAEKLHSLVLNAENLEASERGAHSPSLFGAALHPPTLAALRSSLLSPDTVLLEYWIGRKNVELWVITSHSMRAVRLCGTHQLNAAVKRYLDALLARQQFPPNEDFSQRHARIAASDRTSMVQGSILARLLVPANLGNGIRRLVIVPDGILASVPFAALRQASGSYLVQRYEVVEEPSASVAMALLQRPMPQHAQRKIAIFADPVYNQYDPRLAGRGVDAAKVRSAAFEVSRSSLRRDGAGYDLSELPTLRGSLAEARSIVKIAGADRVSEFLGFQATPARVMHLDWRDYTIAHFAAHAIASRTNPELSGIVLSTLHQNGRNTDGVLWLNDIYRTPMPVSLVVLSGCSTVSGKSMPGEGISGLAQAFLSSGSSSVMGTLWPLSDSAAARMIPAFYRTLLDKQMNTAAALRAAQLRMVQLHEPPYNWAGWVIEGNWRSHANDGER